jgi:hypothetical protein
VGIEDAASEATAVFSDAFQLPGREVDPRTPDMIELDRVVMAARPGMLRKLLPLRVDAHGVTCGGVYLFDTYENAAAYGTWVAEEFVLDVGFGADTLFLDRPVFIEPTAQVWQLIGAEDFADVRTSQDVMRFERWHTLEPADVEDLRARWPEVRRRAQEAGLTSVYLMYAPDRFHPQLGLVTVAANATPPTGDAARDLAQLESQPSLGEEIAAHLGATKVFDRTSWVYEVWFPIEEGNDHEGSTVWPNSPPLPGVEAPVQARG